MSRLADLFRELGYQGVETFIASGNVLFDAGVWDRKELEQRIAAHLERKLGYEVDTFVRTADEVCQVGSAQVFADEGQPGVTVHVGFLPSALPPAVAKRLSAVKTDMDTIKVIGTELYWLCTYPSHESKVWASPEIRQLKLPSFTLRNRTSLQKLIQKHLSGVREA